MARMYLIYLGMCWVLCGLKFLCLPDTVLDRLLEMECPQGKKDKKKSYFPLAEILST